MLAKLFRIDLRSLALFRIAMGLLLICDLINRSRDLVAHYTDYGVLPRDVLHSVAPQMGKVFFPYLLSGSPIFVAALFFISGLIAFCLILGYRTTMMTILSWIFLISLQERNYMVVFGGDLLVRVLLFWAIFLPLGARWSLDSRGKKPQGTVFSAASAAYLLQICIVYWASIAYKWNPSWLEGKAVGYAIHIDQFATPLGLLIQDWHRLHTFFTYVTLGIELFGPMLLFVPYLIGPVRTFMFFLFAVTHLAFGAFLDLGLFPYMSIIGWIPFLPSWFWDHLMPETHETGEMGANRYENCIVASLLIYVVLLNLSAFRPDWNPPFLRGGWSRIYGGLKLYQQWNMFSQPLTEDGWYVIAGTLLNGNRIDLMKGGQPLTWEKPPLVSKTYTSERWRKYMMNIWWETHRAHREPLLSYLCRSWNSTHEGLERLHSIELNFMLEITDPNFVRKPPQRKLIARHDCVSATKSP